MIKVPIIPWKIVDLNIWRSSKIWVIKLDIGNKNNKKWRYQRPRNNQKRNNKWRIICLTAIFAMLVPLFLHRCNYYCYCYVGHSRWHHVCHILAWNYTYKRHFHHCYTYECYSTIDWMVSLCQHRLNFDCI